MSCSRIKKTNQTQAFTLVELMVSVGIILIITAVVMFDYGSFNSATLLRSQAYEVALNTREAQTIAIGVKSQGEVMDFRYPYGIHFDINNRTYSLFQDKDEDGIYEDDDDHNVISNFSLDPRFSFYEICAEGSCNIDTLDVTFTRPNFDAKFVTSPNVGAVDAVEVKLRSDSNSNYTYKVRITSTGLINVSN